MLQRRRVSKIPEPDLLKVAEAGLTMGSLVGSWIGRWAPGSIATGDLPDVWELSHKVHMVRLGEY